MTLAKHYQYQKKKRYFFNMKTKKVISLANKNKQTHSAMKSGYIKKTKDYLYSSINNLEDKNYIFLNAKIQAKLASS